MTDVMPEQQPVDLDELVGGERAAPMSWTRLMSS
jgi:hypothetical protein